MRVGDLDVQLDHDAKPPRLIVAIKGYRVASPVTAEDLVSLAAFLTAEAEAWRKASLRTPKAKEAVLDEALRTFPVTKRTRRN